MDLGEQIKSARIEAGLTQRALAESAGLTERTIQRIENHDVEPSTHSLDKIGEVLGKNFNAEKKRILNFRNGIIRGVLIVWTLALAVNFSLGIMTFESDWWGILIWLFAAIGVLTGEIYVPYRKRKLSKP